MSYLSVLNWGNLIVNFQTEVLQDLDEQLERMFKNLGEADIGFSEETGDAGLNGKASESDKDSFLHPIMHQFLKQMLAKSMMYPSLKHITTKVSILYMCIIKTKLIS